MKRQQVVAAVIQRDGLVFVAQRESGVHAGKWEFPGGKVEVGESPAAALVREINEEFGVEILVGPRLTEVQFSVTGKEYSLLVYLAQHIQGEYRPVVHCQTDWVPAKMLPALDLAPADIPVAAMLAADDGVGQVVGESYENDLSEVVE